MTEEPNFEISRSERINAAPDQVFPLIDQFAEWTKWSPWEGLDPDLQRKYEGPSSGVGQIYHWNGNRKVGEGRMETLVSSPSDRVEIKLSFLKPFKAENHLVIALKPAESGTEVSWTMTGHQTFFQRLFGKLFGMDGKVGADFEKGLRQMKAVAEGA